MTKLRTGLAILGIIGGTAFGVAALHAPSFAVPLTVVALVSLALTAWSVR